MSLGETLRRRREQLGLTQRQLAQRSGVSVRSIRNLEHGQATRPRPALLGRIAGALGLSGIEAGDAHLDLRIGILGTLTAHHGERTVPIPSPRLRTLLGLLAIQPGQRVSCDHIVDVLWDDRPPATSRALVT